jgi:hypothetical protein
MNVALDDVATLDHEPGEINSKTSDLRKNKDRKCQTHDVQGHKADGLVSTKGASHELYIVELLGRSMGSITLRHWIAPWTVSAPRPQRTLGTSSSPMESAYRPAP